MTNTPDEIHRALAAELARHRANTQLSPEGRQRAIAKAYTRAQDKLDSIRQTQVKTTANARNDVEARLFGLPKYSDPAAVIGYRDAQDRAGRIENVGEAQQMLRRAQISGDTQLARAILGRAFETGWGDVVDAYVEADPSIANDVDSLINLNVGDARAATRAERLATDMTYKVGRPQELSGLNDTKIAQLAIESIVTDNAQQSDNARNHGLLSVAGYRLAGDDTPGAA